MRACKKTTKGTKVKKMTQNSTKIRMCTYKSQLKALLGALVIPKWAYVEEPLCPWNKTAAFRAINNPKTTTQNTKINKNMHHFQTTVAQRNQQQTARSNLNMIDLSKLIRLSTYPMRTAQVIEVNRSFCREHSGRLRRWSIDAIAI